jgi:hypothetical protein
MLVHRVKESPRLRLDAQQIEIVAGNYVSGDTQCRFIRAEYRLTGGASELAVGAHEKWAAAFLSGNMREHDIAVAHPPYRQSSPGPSKTQTIMSAVARAKDFFGSNLKILNIGTYRLVCIFRHECNGNESPREYPPKNSESGFRRILQKRVPRQ